MGHLAALPSPFLAQACGRAGAGKKGSRLPGGVGRGGDGHGRACGCRVKGRADGSPRQFDLPQTFSVSAWLAAAGGAGGSFLTAPWFGLEALPVPPDRPADGLGELQPALCVLRGGGSPRGCADRAQGPARGRSPAPAGSMCAGGQATFPPRPYPGGNQSSLLFSMSLRSLPFVPRYLSLPGIRAAPRWLGEGLAVARISHLKTTMESFRPARVVPELYFCAGHNGIVCFAFVFTAKLEGKLQEG